MEEEQISVHKVMNRWLLNDDDDCLYEDMKMDYNVRLKRNIQRYSRQLSRKWNFVINKMFLKIVFFYV